MTSPAMTPAPLAQPAPTSGPIVFVTTMHADPWGGSEELWSDTAFHLAQQGVRVGASVVGWVPAPKKIKRLEEAGADLHRRPHIYPLITRAKRALGFDRRDFMSADVERYLDRVNPALVVINEQYITPPLELLEACRRKGWRYVMVLHANSENWWAEDKDRARFQHCFAGAHRVFFVSHGNWRLARKQIGMGESNLDIVRNTFSTPFNAAQNWPASDTPVRLASVGRLFPSSKGQDLLLEALSQPQWRARDWRLTFYGNGPVRGGLEMLVGQLGLDDKVDFAGHKTIAEIWAENHALMQTSRAEGLPITIVEAMLSGRPVLTTDVAGNAELLEDNVTGFVADAPTAKSVAEALERLWTRRADLQVMGEAAAAHARKVLPPDPAGVFAAFLREAAYGAAAPVAAAQLSLAAQQNSAEQSWTTEGAAAQR